MSSIEGAFYRSITIPNIGFSDSPDSCFARSSLELLESFFVLIDSYTQIKTENASQDATLSYAISIKSFMRDDIATVTKLIKAFIIGVRSRQVRNNLSIANAVVSEREAVFANQSVCRISILNQLASRKLREF